MVELELAAQFAVVAPLGLSQALEVRGQVVLGEPGGAIDALQLLVALVATPVHTGHALQLDGTQVAGVGDVGSATKVDEVARAVDAHRVDVTVEPVDDGHLERLAHVAEQPVGRVAADHLALKRDARACQLVHASLDAGQVLLAEMRVTGEPEVVEEPVLDGRTDVVLCAGIELHHRRGHQVGCAVAEDVKRQLRGRVERQASFSGVVNYLVRHEVT